MKSKGSILAVLIFLLAFNLACITLFGEQENVDTATPEAAITEEQEEVIITEAPEEVQPAACPVITEEIMQASLAESTGEEEQLDEELYLVTYTVSGDEISDPYYEDVDSEFQDMQDDQQSQQDVWDFFTVLIPADERAVIREYSAMTDGKDGTLAAVTQTKDDPSAWALEVDLADTNDYKSLTFTLIHEFGHLLTLGPDQVPPSEAVFNNPDDNDIYLEEVSNCPQYFPGEGCANADSYINAYYNQFWADLHDEWNEINLEEDEDIYYEELDAFYTKYQDQFVTDYAATNPEEDMAETWAFFILTPKPAGDSIAEEKILFFYQYPELVALREKILSNVCTLIPE